MDSEASARDLLEGMLLDANAEPTYMPLSLLNSITSNFSNDQQVGSGGFAVVYKGSLRNGTVAVKKLTKTHGVYETKFHQEIDSLMRVKHKNIVRFLGHCADTQGKAYNLGRKNVIAEERQWFLCFEFLPEGSLDKYISDASQGVEWMTRYQIIKGICEGLHYLHQKQIVHLDLKPANILLDRYMVPKIADFGLSRCFDENQTRAMTSNVSGSLGYMAPECYDGLITFKSDIYSLGIIIIEILTGQKGYLEIENILESWTARFRTPLGDTWLEPIRVCTEIGMECIDFNPEKRPVTRRIIERLAEMERTYGFIKTDLFITSSLATNVEQIGKIDEVVKLETMARINLSPSMNYYNFPVLVRVTAPLRCTENSRAGLDLVAVIDVSGNTGSKNMLVCIKMAMMFVIDKLGPKDRLSVVWPPSFSMELSYMSEENREVTRQLVRALVALFCYNILAAMEVAAEILRQRGPEERSNRAGRIIFLSDREDTSNFYQCMGCEFPVETFGFGTSHDPNALRHIASRTMGVYSYVIKDPEEIEAAFAMSLGGLMSIIAMDVQVELHTFGGVTISSIDSGSFHKSYGYGKRSCTIHVEDLYAGEQKNFVVYLTVPKGNVRKLMTASGWYKSPRTTTIQLDASEVVVQWTAATTPSEENEAVSCQIDSFVSIPSPTSTVAPRLAAMYKEVTDLVSIEKPRAVLISWLSPLVRDVKSTKKTMKMKMVSVVGVGGLGKTTLAKAVYDKLKVDFECMAFVPVGRHPDLNKVFKDILIELDKNKYIDPKISLLDLRQLIDELREYLRNKRYFIVIDDIWETKSWRIINLALVENNRGSRVITTTRKLKVAMECDIYMLQHLDYDESKKLFHTRIFGAEGKCLGTQLDVLSDKMIKKCDGIPLAIITMANFLVGNGWRCTALFRETEFTLTCGNARPPRDHPVNPLLSESRRWRIR